MYRIGPDADSSDANGHSLREFAGTYMQNCHNTQHEVSSILLRWDIEHPGQFQLMPTPLPGWDGVQYVNSAALPTFRTNNTGPGNAGNNPPVAVNDSAATSAGL